MDNLLVLLENFETFCIKSCSCYFYIVRVSDRLTCKHPQREVLIEKRLVLQRLSFHRHFSRRVWFDTILKCFRLSLATLFQKFCLYIGYIMVLKLLLIIWQGFRLVYYNFFLHGVVYTCKVARGLNSPRVLLGNDPYLEYFRVLYVVKKSLKIYVETFMAMK